jgi:DNA-binding transcriptional MerR regulator
VIDNRLYRIGEASKLIGVKPYVLRYWETQFPFQIRPTKSKRGQRIYSQRDIERIKRIKELLWSKGFSIAAVRKLMNVARSAHPHLVEGEFQSDKYPTTPRGKVPLSCADPAAQDLLWEYAQRHRSIDPQFSDDLEIALKNKGFQPGKEPPGERYWRERAEEQQKRANQLEFSIRRGEAI